MFKKKHVKIIDEIQHIFLREKLNNIEVLGILETLKVNIFVTAINNIDSKGD